MHIFWYNLSNKYWNTISLVQSKPDTPNGTQAKQNNMYSCIHSFIIIIIIVVVNKKKYILWLNFKLN